MAGSFNKKEEVTCCFCGEGLLLKDAAVLSVKPSIESDEEQGLFCHKNHFVERIHKSIPLHPDFFEEED
jgi:hypothetical protein